MKMKNILTLCLFTLSSFSYANCKLSIEKVLQNPDADKSVIRLMAEGTWEITKKIYGPNTDLYSVIVGPAAVVVLQPILGVFSVYRKHKFANYQRLSKIISEDSDIQDTFNFRLSMARRYIISNEEFEQEIKDMNDSLQFCNGRSVVATTAGMEFLAEHGYSGPTELAMNGRRDYATFRQFMNTPEFLDMSYMNVIPMGEIKDRIQRRLDEKGYAKKPLNQHKK